MLCPKRKVLFSYICKSFFNSLKLKGKLTNLQIEYPESAASKILKAQIIVLLNPHLEDILKKVDLQKGKQTEKKVGLLFRTKEPLFYERCESIFLEFFHKLGLTQNSNEQKVHQFTQQLQLDRKHQKHFLKNYSPLLVNELTKNLMVNGSCNDIFQEKMILQKNNFSKTYLAQTYVSPTPYLIRVIEFDEGNTKDFFSYLLKAYQKEKCSPSKEQIKILGFGGFLNTNKIFIQYEFLEGELLATYLNNENLTDKTPARSVLAQKIINLFHDFSKNGGCVNLIQSLDLFITSKGQIKLFLPFKFSTNLKGQELNSNEQQEKNELFHSSYKAPEEFMQKAGLTRESTAVYRLGIILFEIITGQLPFHGNSKEIKVSHLYKKPPQLNKAVEEGFGWINSTITKCLEKKPGKRPSLNELSKIWNSNQPQTTKTDRFSTWPKGTIAGERKQVPGLLDAWMIWCPSGEFTMGASPDDLEAMSNEYPIRQIEFHKGFWIWETPVTQAQFKALMNTNPSHFHLDTKKHPVEKIDWYDALIFCDRLSRRLGFEVSFGGSKKELKSKHQATKHQKPPLYQSKNFHEIHSFRLPTEAEWEYACRANSLQSRYEDLSKIAWFVQNSNKMTHSVRQKQANEWGIYDTLGNVWEWVFDGWNAQKREGRQVSPVFETGMDRVIRGGSCLLNGIDCRASARKKNIASDNQRLIGFRPVLIPFSKEIR